MAIILGSPRVQYFYPGTSNPLSGGLLYSYTAGTLTAAPTYPTLADAGTGTNANANPTVLDSSGSAMIVLQGATKLILKDSDGNTVFTEDNVSTADSGEVAVDGATVITLTDVGSAVNLWNISNAASGNGPILAASGTDTNVAGNISSKGSGQLNIDAGATGKVVIGASSTGNIELKRATVANVSVSVTGTLTASSTVTLVNATVDILPAGMVMAFASHASIVGWLLCDGSAVSRTTYATLYSSIGTGYGAGDGSTTFNLPNMSRRVIMGSGGSATGTISNVLGSTGGDETHTLTTTQLPAHNHPYTRTLTGSTFTSNAVSGVTAISTLTSSTIDSSNAGGGGAHNNVQPCMVMFYMIKY